jgi:hypothetical protein
MSQSDAKNSHKDITKKPTQLTFTGQRIFANEIKLKRHVYRKPKAAAAPKAKIQFKASAKTKKRKREDDDDDDDDQPMTVREEPPRKFARSNASNTVWDARQAADEERKWRAEIADDNGSSSENFDPRRADVAIYLGPETTLAVVKTAVRIEESTAREAAHNIHAYVKNATTGGSRPMFPVPPEIENIDAVIVLVLVKRVRRNEKRADHRSFVPLLFTFKPLVHETREQILESIAKKKTKSKDPEPPKTHITLRDISTAFFADKIFVSRIKVTSMPNFVFIETIRQTRTKKSIQFLGLSPAQKDRAIAEGTLTYDEADQDAIAKRCAASCWVLNTTRTIAGAWMMHHPSRWPKLDAPVLDSSDSDDF